MVFSSSSIGCSLRLDQACIFLPPTHQVQEEAKPSVSGVLCVSVSSDTVVRGIYVQVKGKTSLPFQEGIISSTCHEEVTFERTQNLAASKKMASFTLPAGKYEFPFDISLDTNMHDTITGPNHSYHSYQVYGIIERRIYRDDVVSQPLRIYKPVVMDRCDILDSDPITTEDLSDATIPYSVSIPHKTIPFGSTFPVNFWMAPLDKGLKMKTINIAVVEKHSIKIDAPAAYATRYGVRYLTSAKDHVLFSERHHEQEEDYLAPATEMFDIEWSATTAVPLPKSLDACTQRVKSNHIQIHHELVFTVELVNEKGNPSAIKGALPLNIVILPHSVTPDNLVHGFELEDFLHDNDAPPPLYGAHMIDPLLAGNLTGLELCSGGQYGPLTADLTCLPCYDREFGSLHDREISARPQRLISG